MEFDEMEGYLFESLEIIATTPISQYYGPENDQNELDSWPCHAHPNLQSDPLSPSKFFPKSRPPALCRSTFPLPFLDSIGALFQSYEAPSIVFL
jgi:hypothetical protein